MCLSEMVPDLLYGDLPAELILRAEDEVPGGGGGVEQNDVMIAWLQNGRRAGMELLTSREKTTRFWSLSDQTGMQTTGPNQNGMPASTKADMPHSMMQNGIGSHCDGMEPHPNTSGLHIRQYYTSEEKEGCRHREAGAVRMVGGSYTLLLSLPYPPPPPHTL